MSGPSSRPVELPGLVPPPGVTRVGSFGPHTSLQEEHLRRRAETVERRFDETPAFQALRSSLTELGDRLTNTFHPPRLAGTTHVANAVAEQFLRTFCEKVYLPHVYGSESSITVTDVLSCPPRHSISTDRLFWKMLASFIVHRLRPSYTNDDDRLYISTARRNLNTVVKMYRRLTHQQVNSVVLAEAESVVGDLSIRQAKPEPVATFRDLHTFVSDGIFGNNLLLRCPREQLQLAALHLLVAYCAARPGEIVLTKLATDGIQYRDLNFYLTTWDEEDDNEPDSELNGENCLIMARDTHDEPNEASELNVQQQCRRSPPKFRLGLEVTFRHLKGRRTDPSEWRSQPLYDSGGPACMQAVLILAQMAEQDGVFDHEISIASVMETADPSYFDEEDFLPIPIKPEAADRFVFRAIEFAPSQEGRTTDAASAQESGISDKEWVVSASTPYNYSMALDASKKIALSVDMPDYKLYTLRRMTIQALDSSSLSEGAKTLSVGHGSTSATIIKSYLSRRNVVDIQGLVQHGRENRGRIMLHGVRRVQAIHRHPSSLDPAGRAAIESTSMVQKLIGELQEARDNLNRALAQHFSSEECEALSVELRKRERRLGKARRILRQRMQIERAYLDCQNKNVRALFGGEGPAATARRLARQLGDVGDEENDSRTGISASSPSSAPSQDATTLDPIHFGEGSDWLGRANSVEVVLQNSAFCDSSDETSGGASVLDSTTPEEDTATSISSRSSSSMEPQAIRLKDSLEELRNTFGSMSVDLPQPDYTMLKEAGVRAPLREIFAAMTTNNAGTQNAVILKMKRDTGDACPWCHKTFRSLIKPDNSERPVGRMTVIQHLTVCSRPHMASRYKEACFKVVAGQQCWHEDCNGKVLPEDYKELEKHLNCHHDHSAKTICRLSDMMATGSFRCPYFESGSATRCSWALYWDKEERSSVGEAFRHLETTHGIPVLKPPKEMSIYCAWHDKWLFGFDETDRHFCSHVDALLNGYADPNWLQRNCRFLPCRQESDNGHPRSSSWPSLSSTCLQQSYLCRSEFGPSLSILQAEHPGLRFHGSPTRT